MHVVYKLNVMVGGVLVRIKKFFAEAAAAEGSKCIDNF